MRDTRYERFRVERRANVLLVTFANPPRNFFDERATIEFRSLVRDIERDDAVRAVVITGEGTFVTHADVRDLLRGAQSAPFRIPYGLARVDDALGRAIERVPVVERLAMKTRAGNLAAMPRINRALRRVNRSEKVYIAAVNGLALGMGAILSLACDIRIMIDDDTAGIGFVESGISMLASASGTQRLVRTLGHARALELLLEGGWLSPRDAAAIGLVNRVVAPDALVDEALAVAHRMAARSPAVTREVKRMVYEASDRPLRRALRMENASLLTTMSHPRAAEDMQLFLDRLRDQPDQTDQSVLDVWTSMLGVGRIEVQRNEPQLRRTNGSRARTPAR